MNCKGEVYLDGSEEGPLIDLRESSAEIDAQIRGSMGGLVNTSGRYFLLGNNCRDFSGEFFRALDGTYGRGWFGAGLGGKPYWPKPK
jgi:hypothetical protein